METLEFSVTYTTVTPGSAEYGDFDDSGFEINSITFNYFCELVDYIESNGFRNWSNSDNTGWLSTDYEIEDYSTMEEKQLSIHAQNSRAQRYLELAYRFI